MTHIIELDFVAENNPACWCNFVDSFREPFNRNWHGNLSHVLGQDYSAEISFKDEKNLVGPILVFDNEQDYIRFVLRWS